MGRRWLWIGGAAFLVPTAASAADQLKFGKPPEWVVPQAIPPASGKSPSAPVSILLTDQQIRFEPGKTTTYSEVAMKLQTPDGLAAGNISLPWNPAADTVTVNKLQIRRSNQIIDVLASGQTFTTMRRETNLDLAMLDGVLTATIQPEGLQQGDVVDLAITIDHVDPVFGTHVESNFMQWSASPIQLAHLHLDWPDSLPLNVQTKGFPVTKTEHGGRKEIELTEYHIEPIVPPKGAPARFSITRLGEATDLASWADLAKLTAPLYRKAEEIPSVGPLHDEVEKIRTSTADPKLRAVKALQLVQDRVRYVALSMGQGGYLPADAGTTWSRRFGDCKAKTALLLGILHSLGIEAEPVLVNALSGDHIAERLPMIGLFNHVLVRAHIGAKGYFLDGTRTGDSDIDAIDVPAFDWGLPLLPDAKLVAMVPPPLDRPAVDTKVLIDATTGVRATVRVTVDQILHGDDAVVFNKGLGALADTQRTEFFNNYWKASFDFITSGSTKATFDAVARTLSLSMTGTGKLDWTTGYFQLPDTTLGFSPAFERPAGPSQNAPVAVSYPTFTHNMITVRFPPGFFGQRPSGATPTTKETLAGVEYRMSATNTSSPEADTLVVESSERSLAPEITYADALAATPRLRELSDQQVLTPLPRYYRPTKADFASWLTEKPSSANGYLDRGNALMDAHRFDEGIADFSEALVLDPKNVVALADRALAHVWKNDFAGAKKDLASAEELDAGNAIVLRAHAFLAEKQDDYPLAISYYTKSIEKEPNSFALFHRSLLHRSTWKYDAAIADLTEILTRDTKNVEALSFRALAYAAKGDSAAAQRDLAAARAVAPGDGSVTYAEAQLAKTDRDSNRELQSYAKLLETTPLKGPILSERASTFFRLNRYDEALADTEQALKLGYTETDIRLTRANIFMRRGERSAVEAEADAMMRENPQSTLAFVAAGKSYQALGLREKAVTALDHAISMQPSVMTYLNRADVRPSTDLAGRLADIEKALALEPDDVDALLQKAYNLTLKGDYAQALQLYDRAATIETDPDNRSIPAGRAVALYKSGQIDKARETVAAMRAHSKSATDFESLCWTQARWNMFVEEAVKDCAKAEQLDPKTDTGNFGFALVRAGRFNDAIEKLNRSIALSHGAESYMARAIAYRRKGQMALASSDHAEALKLRPDEDQVFAEYGLKFDETRSALTTTP